MLLHLQTYNLKIVYKPGKEPFIADTLSWAFVHNEQTSETKTPDVYAVEEEEYLIKVIEEIDMFKFLPITTERLADLRKKTEHWCQTLFAEGMWCSLLAWNVSWN